MPLLSRLTPVTGAPQNSGIETKLALVTTSLRGTMADASREEKLKAARETFKQLQKKKAGGKPAGAKAKKQKDDEPKEPEATSIAKDSDTVVEVASPDIIPEIKSDEPSVAAVEAAAVVEPPTDDSALRELQAQLAGKDSRISSLQDKLSNFQTQEEKYKREILQHSTYVTSKDKEIASLRASDSEKDSTISSLQLELGQLREQLTTLQETSTSAPTAEQLTALTQERDNLKTQLAAAQEAASKSETELQKLRETHNALEKDTKTTHESLVNIRNEQAKLKEAHSAEIQKSRLSHSRAAELQLENKTLISRVEELKQKVVSLTSEKVDLVERTDSLDKELFKLRKNLDSAVAGGARGSVELNTELDALIQGQETRQAIRETNQRRYSQFVGEKIAEGDGETMREINERRLKKSKESGEYGRERETGFIVDLVSARGGCGMCVGEVLVL